MTYRVPGRPAPRLNIWQRTAQITGWISVIVSTVAWLFIFWYGGLFRL